MTIKIFSIIGCAITFGLSQNAFAACGNSSCNITAFSGTTDQKIEFAIQAAKNTSHKTVYIPNGVHEITQTIQISDPNNTNDRDVNLKIIGQSDTGAILKYIPTPVQREAADGTTLLSLPPALNVDKIGGFNSFNLSINKLTIDMSETRTHPYYLYPSPSTVSSAHGIRVGNGWTSGSLTLQNIRINNSGGYGIGIQTVRTDKNADNVVMKNIHIENAGSDGIDTKSPVHRLNKNLRLFNVNVKDIGQNDSRNAVGIDIRYEDFYLRGFSFTSDANVVNPLSSSGAATVGIEVRGQSAAGAGGTAPANNGILRNLDISGGNSGIFIDRENSNIDVKIAHIKNALNNGIYVRDGQDITLRVGCVWNAGAESIRIVGNNTNVTNLMSPTFISQCESYSVGSSYKKNF